MELTKIIFIMLIVVFFIAFTLFIRLIIAYVKEDTNGYKLIPLLTVTVTVLWTIFFKLKELNL